MYEVPRYYITNGNTVNQETRILMDNIRQGRDVERSKDDLFRLTYPMALTELKRYKNMGPMDELVSCMSIAFMKTVKYYDPEASIVSFMNYYKRAINSEVIMGINGRYRSNPQLKRDFEANIGSLEYELSNDDGSDNLNIHEMVADDYWDGYFDEKMNYEGLIDDIRTCMYNVMYKKQKGRRVRSTKSDSKKSFEIWVEAMINEDEELTQQQVADDLGIGKSAVNNAVSKYMPRLREELKNMGY
jgi:DNA-directed RNA polymerase specialized sigma subunit